ncbi:MAG: D-2-hydroxyacid dehydrogenase [Anaerolineae bacterium]
MSIFLLTLGANQLSDSQLDQIRDRLPAHMTLVQENRKEEVAQYFPEVEAIAGWFKPAYLLELPKLKWAHFWGVGTDWLQRYPQMAEETFTLTNVAGHSTTQINEHIFGMLLSLGRNLRNAHVAQQAGVWARTHQPAEAEKFKDTPFAHSAGDLFELTDKMMLILGLGGIGQRTAMLAKAFGMNTIGVRRNPDRLVNHVDQMAGMDQLPDVLPQADVIVVTLPYTQETHHLFDAEAFSAMKSSAIFINIGRGKIVDEGAMISALQNKSIRAAALDVFEEEPLPADSPLWQLDNALITSHYAGSSPRYHERALAIFLDNLDRWRDGKPLNNLVDKAAGY